MCNLTALIDGVSLRSEGLYVLDYLKWTGRAKYFHIQYENKSKAVFHKCNTFMTNISMILFLFS